MQAKLSHRSLIPARCVVSTPEAVALVTNFNEDSLHPFLGKECSVKEAAAELGVHPNTMLRRVRRLLRCGLLVVTRTQARAGRSIRHYRASADEFRVPLSAFAIEEMLWRNTEPLMARLHRSIAKHWTARNENPSQCYARLYRDQETQRVRLQAPHHDDPSRLQATILSQWAQLSLSEAEHQALHSELAAILERYARQSGSGKVKSLLHIGLVQTPPQ